MQPSIAISLVFLGCCSDIIFLELLIRDDPESGNLVTFFHFLLIAAEGFVITANFGRKKSTVPVKHYIMLVMLMFVTSILNNYVLGFNISMPLHMIFRSGSLITNMILGIIILKKRYKITKYVSVIMITIGVIICTLESGKLVQSHTPGSKEQTSDESWYDLVIWSMGVAMLTLSLFLSARMGLLQETLAQQFGKHPKEAAYYSHIMPLPGFLLLAPDIIKHMHIFNNSDPISVPFISFLVPKLWLCLAANTFSHYMCTMSVFQLAAETSSLTVTLVVTLRKFVSLLLSIVYFQNPFTWLHWVGTCLVFGGTLLFTETHIRLLNLVQWDKQKIA